MMFPRNTALLSVIDTGSGEPVVFQHGLGGDAAQVAENFPDGPLWRRVTVECRAQGTSSPGERRPFSLALFADDILAVCDSLGIFRFVMGGISMGAAIALRIAARAPERVSALVLARPAWLFDPAPVNMRPFAEVADLLRTRPPAAARDAFAASPTAAMLERDAPDNLASLLRFFERADPAVTADLLGDIARDGPGVSEAGARRIGVPTLVIGHGADYVHPLAFARILAETIQGARLAVVTPKATDRALHATELRHELGMFLMEHRV